MFDRVAANACNRSASASTFRAPSTTSRPTSVSANDRVVRRSSVVPKDVSKAATARETDPWVTPSAIAASVKVPSSTTATSARSCRSSTHPS